MISKRPRGFTPTPVSKYYFYDWQYAAGIAGSTGVLLIPVLFLLLSSIIDVQKAGLLVIPRPLAFAAVVFVDALLCVYLFCPRFIREYRDFGQYRAKIHSHRWIVWEFYNNLSTLAGWGQIVKETVAKGISQELSQFPDGEIKIALTTIMESNQGEDTITIYKPQNFNRDIYLPIQLEDQKVILFLEEDDPKLPEKEKELFWILFSQAAKEKPYARVMFWILFFLAIIIGGASIIYTIGQLPLK